MKIFDSYSKLLTTFSVSHAHPVFQAWEYNDAEIAHWFEKVVTANMRQTAGLYLAEVSDLVVKVEDFFKRSLPGELVLIPSMGEIDGFARYDRGHHAVMLGIDYPDASIDYLRALTAHELSHVYRDHSPNVWGFLGKPLAEVSRSEYLEATSAREHLVSEGLATLTSQAMFPDIPVHLHHYYEPSEMSWCESNFATIDSALQECLAQSDPDPWRFYQPGLIGKGSPSHAHYFWAAKKIDAWIKKHPSMTLLQAHALPADQIDAF